MTSAVLDKTPDDVSGVESPRGQKRKRQRQLSIIEDTPRPFVKWAGGKGKLLGDLVSRLPADLGAGRFFEPFVGGGALFFATLPISGVISDINPELIELYREIARDPVGLHAAATEICAAHARSPEETYYSHRLRWNDDRGGWSPQYRGAVFLYLNRACFNGLFRVNRRGRMNVPIGRSKSGPSCPSMARLSAASLALRGCEILCGDYVDAIVLASSGDFVYLDPPYLAKSKTASFASYAADGFSADDHDELGRRAVDLVARGVRVMVSSADVPGARERYPGFAVYELTAPRQVAARASSRAPVGELIMIGGYEPADRGAA